MHCGSEGVRSFGRRRLPRDLGSAGRRRCGSGGRAGGRRGRGGRAGAAGRRLRLLQQLRAEQDHEEGQRQPADDGAGQEGRGTPDLVQIHLCIMRHFPGITQPQGCSLVRSLGRAQHQFIEEALR
jgi:hypothetical protein